MIRSLVGRFGLKHFAFASIVLLTPAAACAQEAATSGAPGLQPICADRPTKANGPCTVDVGHFQIEADIVNASFMHEAGVTTDNWLVLNPTLKYGLAPNLDIEVNIAPVQIVRVKDAAGAVSTQTGVGDLFLRLKYEFLNTPGVQAAVIPYVKAPTARLGIGDGAWEGGLIAPVNIKLSSSLNLVAQPEFDDLLNGSGAGHHLAVSQDLNLAWSLPHNVTLFAEVWGQWSFDPTGTQSQYSADIAAALGLGRDSQLDAGINFGLNRATPGVAPYIGYSHRF
jgi:hypothetical protein